MIDRSYWPEAVPLSSVSTEVYVRDFISTWVSKFGVPATLTSDRGGTVDMSMPCPRNFNLSGYKFSFSSYD